MVATSVLGEETKKDINRVVDPDLASKLLAATSSSFQSSETGKEAVHMVLTSGLSVATTSSNLESRIESIPEDTTPMEDKIDASSISSQAEGSPSSPSVNVSITKETHEQGSKRNVATDEAIMAAQSTDPESMKQFRASSMIAQITQSTKDTMKQGLEKNYSEDDAMTAVHLTSDLSGNDYAQDTKEERDSSVQEEHKLENATKTNIPDNIPPLYHQARGEDADPSAPVSRICEMVLLAQAPKRYPQLVLPHEHLTDRITSLYYRVLVDILIMLATKIPRNITAIEKSTLEANLNEIAFLGFNKEWVDLVHARVFGLDISDVLAAEDKIQVLKVELETCDIALEQVQKQRVEAEGGLVVARRQLEMAQSEFEAIDS
ncbi:uncharacterized protein LOC129317800 isoform X2 [Prosopis cineraria]|uniref:uncharacterized protein LOC129317800 isoform X2 n=1 Tax=Prosopis cineraria TaxID=364024 RepID=UPI00240EACA7|nr:uncharacterized protein LOC129317800 isoform X2 [Prosopis cineraria]